MGSARHRRRSGKKLLGFEARGGVYGGSIGAKPQATPRGITNEQAKELGRLCRARGVPYPGSGMTLNQAKREIARLRSQS